MNITLFKGILFGIFGVAALIGIFVFATYTNNNSSNGGNGPVLIWGTLPADAIQNLLVTAGQTDEGLRSVMYVEKSAETLPSELAAAIATDTGPDLVLDSQENLHALQKFISPIPFTALSPATFTNSFIGGARVFAATEGYYGIPFLVDPIALFANRSILATVGIPKPPSTWEGLVGLVPKVAEYTPSRQIARALIGLGTYPNVQNAAGILETLFLQQGVPLSVYENGYLKADLGVSGPGAPVLVFYTQFADPSKISYTWNTSLPDSRQAFLSGNSALYLGFISEAEYLSAANPNLEVTVTPVPQPATASAKAAYGRVYAFMVARGAHNGTGGYNVAVKLVNSYAAVAGAATGRAPALLTDLSSPPSDAVGEVAYTEALYTKTWLSPSKGSTDTVFSAMIQNVMSSRISLESALANAEGSLTALLQK
jgi:ABC-type glycerol-3-phosphate transport system substrate-binding protein